MAPKKQQKRYRFPGHGGFPSGKTHLDTTHTLAHRAHHACAQLFPYFLPISPQSCWARLEMPPVLPPKGAQACTKMPPGSVSKPCTPVVHIKIAGKWMFIPLKMGLIGIDPYPPETLVILLWFKVTSHRARTETCWELGSAHFPIFTSKPQSFPLLNHFCSDLAVKSIQAATKDDSQANCEFRTHSIAQLTPKFPCFTCIHHPSHMEKATKYERPAEPAKLTYRKGKTRGITMFNGKNHYKWQFSIDILVYQRVYPIKIGVFHSLAEPRDASCSPPRHSVPHSLGSSVIGHLDNPRYVYAQSRVVSATTLPYIVCICVYTVSSGWSYSAWPREFVQQ